MTRALQSLARVAGRFHLWRLTVLLYAFEANPFRPMNESVGRLSYALMLCRGDRLASRVLTFLIRREVNRSAESNLWLAQMAWVVGHPTLALLIYKSTETPFSWPQPFGFGTVKNANSARERFPIHKRKGRRISFNLGHSFQVRKPVPFWCGARVEYNRNQGFEHTRLVKRGIAFAS